eukprot:COSAG02_NODE_1248_length_13631_cov_11.854197_3_plen_73_part_00
MVRRAKTFSSMVALPPLECFKGWDGRSAFVLDDEHLHDLSTKGKGGFAAAPKFDGGMLPSGASMVTSTNSLQ